MAINSTLAVLYAQTNLTARYSHDVAVAPAAALSMARVLAEEMARTESQQVAKVDETAENVLIKQEDSEKKESNSFGNRRRNRPHFNTDSDEDFNNSEDPFIGNLLNVKV